MKTIVINAGPKKRGFNAEMAKSALRGAQSVGAEVEFIDLYRLKFTGCLSCLICMRDDFESCKCFLRDDLSPLIDRILDADCLLIAAPIFFSNPSSHYMALLERLIFCIVSNKGENLFKGKVNVGLIYTFHYDKGYFEESVRPHFKHSEDILKMLNGEVEIYSAEYDSKKTYSTSFDGEISSEDECFTLNLEKTYEIGAKLSN
ncbi:flavodoxin family protein [Methanobrevibacter ruminantium]|uniref:flavodoxin family protein n=1 Tax=Methanobrevibacter ruminantium TaxID=83816 RepID=UPI000662C283|nr:flavodoxin family protein [Methanobrevibacter ruminantium]